MSGDVSLAADATFSETNATTTGRRSIIRQNLEDDFKEPVVAEHGTSMIHLAQRPDRGVLITDMQYRSGGSLVKVMAKRIGLKKHADSIAIFFTLESEPMHEFARPQPCTSADLYAGIGFCLRLPDKSESCRQRHSLPLRDGCNNTCRLAD